MVALIKKYYYKINIEAIVWIVALLYLFIIDPYASNHLDLCLFHNLGIDFCPGCGIGRSISMLFHGNLSDSFSTHPLGIFAIAVILYRIITLLTGKRISFAKNREVYHG